MVYKWKILVFPRAAKTLQNIHVLATGLLTCANITLNSTRKSGELTKKYLAKQKPEEFIISLIKKEFSRS
ncbi:hypothetical protein SteCoe_38955 [Stentor coeruleus]|uniref:Uncharacterized protein n=1 Tax=Stentor coeruleus TaxID=5963 RepID=A0A1R2AL67_9CILI|nr:hypothetical protein SteCoe_38955 [Stentor coeruleus]